MLIICYFLTIYICASLLMLTPFVTLLACFNMWLNFIFSAYLIYQNDSEDCFENIFAQKESMLVLCQLFLCGSVTVQNYTFCHFVVVPG